jgi:pilus assembly protein Flp/PilA
MQKLLRRFHLDQDGASMVEYTVLLGLITAAVIATITLIGGNVNRIFGIVNGLLAAIK